jgi:hypothetical protein
MKQYPAEFKASIITKFLAPNNADISALAKESGIPKDTLYCWRIEHQRRDQQVKAEKIDDNSKINSSEKFDIVIETAHTFLPLRRHDLLGFGSRCRLWLAFGFRLGLDLSDSILPFKTRCVIVS